MPGVNVSLRGTSIGTASDAVGKFSIPVASSEGILIFTFVGYNTRERVVGNLSVIDIEMEPFVEVLSELVVVGYGVQQKKDVTGSIAVADGEELSALPTSNIENNLQGRLAGVHVIKVSLDEILYVESLKDYIKVVTPTKTIITKQSISSLEDSLSRENFIRIHRSFIISLSKIESYNREMVEIAKKEFPICRMYKHEVERS